jgi:hypothetical protein
MLAERRYRYQGRWHYLRPDGAGCFRGDAKLLRFWLEWDQGTMNLTDLTRKFISYYLYLASGAWRESLERIVPHLLIVAQSFGQVRRMRRAAALASAAAVPASGAHVALSLDTSVTLASDLESNELHAPI